MKLVNRAEIGEVPATNGETTVRPSPVAVPLSDVLRPEKNDPNELLRYRFLCRFGTLLLCGPTGIGKSVLALQLAMLWALGRAAFGITPAWSLKSLIIQAEDDDGDLAEIRDGMIHGCGLSPTEAKRACENVIVAREDERSGFVFLGECVAPLLAEHRPDLLWLNPALSYIGGDASSQRDVGGFLRNGLNPLLRKFECACVLVHHTNKPPSGKEKSGWQGGDFAYLGAGSAEWANHARAVLALRSIGSRDVFELQAAKRGARLGWRGKDGTPLFARYLGHSPEPGILYWREVDAAGIDIGGRPRSYDPDELISLLPTDGLETRDWVALAKSECGVSEATLHRERRRLSAEGRILKSKATGKWVRREKREAA